MNVFLILAFLFFTGSVTGWVIELFFRRFISAANPGRRWINPGFCIGPYLPLYGVGLCVLYLIASLERYNPFDSALLNKLLLFLVMAVCMTVIEYIAGIIAVKGMHVRLWDYSGERGNIQGIICPRFSFFWAVLGAVYYLLIHPYILSALDWLSKNLAFSFVVGMFFGVFIIDVAYSAQLVVKIKRFAKDNDVIVRYEHLKAHIRSIQDKSRQKTHFFFPLLSQRPLNEHLREMLSSFEKRLKKAK